MITIPQSIWERMLDEFQRTQKDVERVAYLDGISNGISEVVTTLTFPDAVLEPLRLDRKSVV